jgi:hypothetical protein
MRVGWKVAAAALAASIAMAGPARGQSSPPAILQPVIDQYDPAPGLPGFFLHDVCPPVIDGAGNLLFLAFLEGPTVTPDNDAAIFYGPPDGLQPLLWESQQAPEMPEGIVISSLLLAWECLAENGTVALVAGISGPGIVPGYNDCVLYAGPPGALHKVLQGADPAPGCEPGVYIDSDPAYFRCHLSDNGTLRVESELAGPGITYLNSSAVWIGSPDDLTLVYRDGMQAPGCATGVTFWSGAGFTHNDIRQVSFCGGLRGPGVTSANDGGHWSGAPGALSLVAREGDRVFGMPTDITWRLAGTGVTEINAWGDVVQEGAIQGPGVTPSNERVLYLGGAECLVLAGRGGDLVPEIGPGVTIALLGNTLTSNGQEALYRVKFAGSGISAANQWAMYFGPYGAAELALRDGNPAPTFDCDATLWRVVAVPQLVAMNDVGDVITPTEIQGPGVTDADKVVLWMRHHALRRWVPLLRGGMIVGDRTIYAADEGVFGCGATGGADARAASFNDSGMMAIRLHFTDGTDGIFRLAFPFGDGNQDGSVDSADLLMMEGCWTGPAAELGPDCAVFDLDGDGDVDLADSAMVQQLIHGG